LIRARRRQSRGVGEWEANDLIELRDAVAAAEEIDVPRDRPRGSIVYGRR
jgi:hypothetical protein